MPKPRTEMAPDGSAAEPGALYLSSLAFNRDALIAKPLLDIASVQTCMEEAVNDYNRVELTDREAEYEQDVI